MCKPEEVIKYELPEAVNRELDDDEYESWLNEVFGDVEVCGMTMSSGTVLREMDDCAFRTGRIDYNACEDVWECPTCGKRHRDEEDAQECCFEGFGCPVCGLTYTDEEDAVSCCEPCEDLVDEE